MTAEKEHACWVRYHGNGVDRVGGGRPGVRCDAAIGKTPKTTAAAKPAGQALVMPLSCGNCGGSTFRLRRSEHGAEAECVTCGAVIPNAVLHAATLTSPQTL